MKRKSEVTTTCCLTKSSPRCCRPVVLFILKYAQVCSIIYVDWLDLDTVSLSLSLSLGKRVSRLSGVTTILLPALKFAVINHWRLRQTRVCGMPTRSTIVGTSCRHNEAEKVQFLVIINFGRVKEKLRKLERKHEKPRSGDWGASVYYSIIMNTMHPTRPLYHSLRPLSVWLTRRQLFAGSVLAEKLVTFAAACCLLQSRPKLVDKGIRWGWVWVWAGLRFKF